MYVNRENIDGYLTHHGIKGMRWGVRRFQNPDGSLTQAGKARYSDSEREARSAERKERLNAAKNRSILSTEEIVKRVERLRVEKEFRRLTEEETNPGATATKAVLTSVGTKVATTVLVGAVMYGIKAAFDKKFDTQEFARSVFNGGAKK